MFRQTTRIYQNINPINHNIRVNWMEIRQWDHSVWAPVSKERLIIDKSHINLTLVVTL